MKKLNKKGFTLIELLAVIVILAIIVVVTVPTILNSINDARLSSLHSLSKEVANWYDTSLAQDKLAMTGEKILGNAIVPDDGEWHCLINIKNGEKSLADIYGLSEKDIFMEGDIPDNVEFDKNGMADAVYDGDLYCSSIRINNRQAEVFLIAADGGKFDTGWNGNKSYAISSGSNGYDEINENN